jgi:hypothetical protein
LWGNGFVFLANPSRDSHFHLGSSARRQFATEQLNSIQAARRAKAPVSRDTAEISLWQGDLLTEEVNKS